MSCDGESYINNYLQETAIIASQIDHLAISALVDLLVSTRARSGTVYVLGLGGSLANATHLAADLCQRANVSAQAPESLPELTAYANDHGWARMFVRWLAVRHLCALDLVIALSVGGGGMPDTFTSQPLVWALEDAAAGLRRAKTAAIVGEPGGACAGIADVVVKIPAVSPERKTEHCEGWQGVLHHMIVGHPRLRRAL